MHLLVEKPGLTHGLVSPVAEIPNFMDLTGMGAMVLNWFVESEEVFMFQRSPLILKLSLFLVTAVFIWSWPDVFLHYKVAHNPMAVSCFATTSTSITAPLCRRSSCLSEKSPRRRQHYTLFPYSGISMGAFISYCR